MGVPFLNYDGSDESDGSDHDVIGATSESQKYLANNGFETATGGAL